MERDDCHGQCLIRIASGQHVRWRPCVFECLPRECANHVVCGQWETRTTLDEHGGACLSCTRRFGRVLDIVKNKDPNIECAVCYEPIDLAPCLPQCTHRFCIPCFRVLNKVPAATDVSNGQDVLGAVPAMEEPCLSWTDANTDQAASAACPMCRAKHWLWRRDPVLRPMVVMRVPRFDANPVAVETMPAPTKVGFSSRSNYAKSEFTMNFKPRSSWSNVGSVIGLSALNAGLLAEEMTHYERATGSGIKATSWTGLMQTGPDQYVCVADAKSEEDHVTHIPIGAHMTHMTTSPGPTTVHETMGTFPASAQVVVPHKNELERPHDDGGLLRTILDWRTNRHEHGTYTRFGNNMAIPGEAKLVRMRIGNTSSVPPVPAPPCPPGETYTRRQMEARRAYADGLLKHIRQLASTEAPAVRGALNATVAQLEGIARHLDAEKAQLAADRAALNIERQQLAEDRYVLRGQQLKLLHDRDVLDYDVHYGTDLRLVGQAATSARPREPLW